MKLHKYTDYETYRRVQIQGNAEKLNHTWVQEGNVKFISEYVLQHQNIDFVLCHGTRRGIEQKWF